jgi:hypothetical protein
MSKTRKIVTLQETLDSMFQGENTGLRFDLYKINKAWKQIVGKKIAENTLPDRISRNTLIVNVSNTVWMQELHFLKDIIREKLNACFNDLKLQDIRFKTGKVEQNKQSRWSVDLPALSREETLIAEEESLQIKDENLRLSFQNMRKASLKAKKLTDQQPSSRINIKQEILNE